MLVDFIESFAVKGGTGTGVSAPDADMPGAGVLYFLFGMLVGCGKCFDQKINFGNEFSTLP